MIIWRCCKKILMIRWSSLLIILELSFCFNLTCRQWFYCFHSLDLRLSAFCLLIPFQVCLRWESREDTAFDSLSDLARFYYYHCSSSFRQWVRVHPVKSFSQSFSSSCKKCIFISQQPTLIVVVIIYCSPIFTMFPAVMIISVMILILMMAGYHADDDYSFNYHDDDYFHSVRNNFSWFGDCIPIIIGLLT